MSVAERKKWYYDRKDNAISLKTDDLVLAKADAYKGKRKVKDQWEEELYEVEHQVAERVPSYLVKNQQTGCSRILQWNWHFLITPAKGTPLCMIMGTKQAQCTTTTLEEQTSEGSETEKALQSVNCLLPAQWQTAETPLGWVNRKFCVILWMFSRVSLLDHRWKVWCRGTRGVRESMLVFLQWRYWSHWWG